jgi:hypothetical protein
VFELLSSPDELLDAWTMAVEFISAPSTIASGGSGFIPKEISW